MPRPRLARHWKLPAGTFSARRLPHLLARLLVVGLTWSFPLALAVAAMVPWHPAHAYAWDFRALYGAGASYFHLHSPYAPATLANLTSQQNFVYPLPIAALFVPVSFVPYGVAAALFIVVSAVLVALALRLLGVRDWRCYAIVLLSFPVQLGLKWGTISPLLAFLLALLWRYRDRRWVAVPTLAFVVVSKLFLWPVAIWFLFTRRYRTFTFAVAVSLAACVLAALPFGLSVLTEYPHLLRSISGFEAPQSFSMYALAYAFGLSSAAATGVTIAAGGLVLFAAYRWSRSDQSRAFRAVILAALVLSPLVWEHYLVLLIVPLALSRPRFSPAWVALAWVSFDGFVLGHNVFIFETALVLMLCVVQAGIFTVPRLEFGRFRPRLRLSTSAALLLLWVPFVPTSAAAGGVVPISAALYSTSSSSSSTGAAFIRLAETGRDICWRIWTDRPQPAAEVELVRTADNAVLAQHALAQDTRTGTCLSLAPRAGADLLKHFKRRSGGYELVIRSRLGRPLLAGLLVRRVDAGEPIAQRRVRG